MATTANLPAGALPVDNGRETPDPFVISTPFEAQRHRYSGLDSPFNSVYSTGSPAQAKRALEAHLAETERRLQEASRLGQTLVKQRKQLTERLRDVNTQQADEQVPPELRSKLLQLEKEVNDVTRETARAFLSKSRVPSAESADASVLSSEAQHSPSKVHPPTSRKQRNQAPGRTDDIKLATEISTSLLNQIRELQTAYAEKDEALKDSLAENAQLETDLDGLRYQLRAKDESDQRSKDENWTLEMRLHELTASQKELSDREHRLQQNLKATTAQNASILREFEELKQVHGKLTEDHTAAQKQHESEIAVLKRNATSAESERDVLQHRIDELTSRNRDLAKAITYRASSGEHEVPLDDRPRDEEGESGRMTPDNSPPGSPSKATPRHGALETETLKSSLHHAHRMIQNLKNNIHREKTEKIELKRLLQDARDELEARRGQNGIDSASKKRRSNDKEVFKKPARLGALGAARGSRADVIMDDPDWEDQDGGETPSRRRVDGQRESSATDERGDQFLPTRSMEVDEDNAMATEASDSWETAHEKESATETDAFQTGVETLDGDSSDELTETEDHTQRGRASTTRPSRNNRRSFQSTASTSGDEASSTVSPNEVRTPVQPQSKYKLRINRGGNRQSSARSLGESAATASPAFRDSPLRDSPASIASSSTAPAPGQSLFAELGNFSDVETEEGTPRSTSVPSPRSSPEMLRKSPAPSGLRVLNLAASEVGMIDSSTMTDSPKTEAAESESKGFFSAAPAMIGAALASGIGFGLTRGAKIASPSSTENDTALPNEQPAVAAAERPVHFSMDEAQPAPALRGLVAIQPQQLAYSAVISQSLEPVEPSLAKPPVPAESKAPATPSKSGGSLAYSGISALTSSPFTPIKQSDESGPTRNGLLEFAPVTYQEVKPVEPPRPSTAKKVDDSEAATPTVHPDEEPTRPTSARSSRGFFGSVFRRSKAERAGVPFVVEDSLARTPSGPSYDKENVTDGPAKANRDSRVPFQPVEANTLPPGIPTMKMDRPEPPKNSGPMATEGTQTLLSADDLDKMMKARGANHTPPEYVRPGASPTKAVPLGNISPRKAAVRELTPENRSRRVGSTGSVRSRPSTPPPPLPTEAKQVIAAATQRVPGTMASAITPGTMGPPVMPASAYKNNRDSYRPRTPQQGISPSKGQSTIRTSQQTYVPRSGAASPATTRRSSVSSFASELDHRFNITQNIANAHGFDPQTTDPRMIQAITQTMIGEFLWKYTRKAGREEMSSTRHRRFFWVHPYTRTLYWSERDPSTAGRAQLKAKSVAIEAVRVVTDDNPMPPGLHRKSLVVVTPGRSIVFTASTSQRHETWFNALSYLLLRTSTEREGQDGEMTTEDVDEFNPSYQRSSSRATGRSLSSFASRTTQRTVSPQRQPPSLAQRQSQAAQRAIRPQSLTAQHTSSQSGRWSSLSGRFSNSIPRLAVEPAKLQRRRRAKHGD